MLRNDTSVTGVRACVEQYDQEREKLLSISANIDLHVQPLVTAVNTLSVSKMECERNFMNVTCIFTSEHNLLLITITASI